MKIYDIAGLRIGLDNRFAYTDTLCRDWLSADQTTPTDICARVSDTLLQKEAQNNPGYSEGYLENLALMRGICERLPIHGRFLLHGCVVEVAGRGYVFLGKSGAGKSTHASLWVKTIPGARILNGDKPILEVRGTQVFAYGTPWRGKENIGYPGQVKLAGLCYIRQAPENRITPLASPERVRQLLRRVYLPAEAQAVAETLALLNTAVSLPAYLLDCTVSKQAAQLAYNTLCGLPEKKSEEED